MKLALTTSRTKKLASSCLIVGIYENGHLTPAAEEINQANRRYLSKLVKEGQFQGKIGQTLHLYHLPSASNKHVLLVGCGPEKPLNAGQFRKIISSSLKAFTGSKTTQAVHYLSELAVENRSLAWKIKFMAETALDVNYRFDVYKKTKEPPLALKELTFAIDEKADKKACELALKQGVAIAQAVTFTKNLGNQPCNVCTPTYLADEAKTLAAAYSNIDIHILEEKDMQKMGMGSLLAVAQGSAQDAKLICLEYKGANSKGQRPIAFIGKGITFDTGGISLKTPDGMVGMKYDMCGAATVLGVFKAVAELKLPVHIIGLMPAVENMPGPAAYKPEDILTSLSGQTIEVISTDAEGRLVLADAMTYCERYQPEVVIDIATLTGAVIIALGYHATGMLSNQQELADALIAAGQDSFDRVWQLPLWDEYQEQLKSPFADMANVGGRAAGAVTAGCFLSRFAKKFHWAHLDVAGTAAMMSGTSDRMATGRPVPLLVQYLLNRINHGE